MAGILSSKRNTARVFENIVIILAIFIVLIELYCYLRGLWLRKLLEQQKKAKRTRKPMVLKPKSERDCHFFQAEKGKRRIIIREPPEPWSMKNGRGGRKNLFSMKGYFCSNRSCDYDRISDEQIHARVA